MKFKLGLGAMLLCVAAVSAQENYAQWSYYKNVTVNTKATGANVATTQVNFPVLVRLGVNDSGVFLNGGTGGASVRFAKPNGTKLRYQIDNWDSAGRAASIWVLADSVKGNDSSVALRLYFGKTGVVDSSKSAAVFDTAHGYGAVWHLGESASPSLDATVYSSPAVWQNGPVSADGVIGKSINLNNANVSGAATHQFLAASYNAANSNFKATSANGITVSAWVNRTDSTIGGATHYGVTGIAGRFRYTGGNWRMYALTENNKIKATGPLYRFNFTNNGTTETILASTNSGVDATWYHLTATLKNGVQSLYRNGVLMASGAVASLPQLDSAWANVPFTIGKLDSATGNNQVFNGRVDEVRLSKLVRDSNWIKLEYGTQNAAQTAVSVGATVVPTAAPTNLTYAIDSAIYTAGLAIMANAATVNGVIDSFTVSPALPTGLAINKTTGAISGTPATATALASYTVTAKNSNGTATRVLKITVIPLPAPSAFTYKVNPAIFTVGVAIAADTAKVTGVVDSFTVSPALPTGLVISKTTGLITGTPTVATLAANYTVTARNASGTATVALNITVSAAAESYPTWGARKIITINTSATGANIATTLTKFPLLIRLNAVTDTNVLSVFYYSKGKGADLRFTKADSVTVLPHQVERWDSAAKQAEIWVLVDSVKGNNATQSIRMFWEKTGAVSTSSGPAVFDTGAGYAAVWHLNEPVSPSLDATQNATPAVWVNVPVAAAGAVGKGVQLANEAATTGGNDGSFLSAGYNPVTKNFRATSVAGITLSAWVKRTAPLTPTEVYGVQSIASRFLYSGTAPSNNRRMYGLSDANGASPTYSLRYSTTGSGGGTEFNLADPSAATIDNEWYHLTGTLKSGAQELYVNGTLVATSATAGVRSLDSAWADVPFTIGKLDSGTANPQYFQGSIDEVQLTRGTRSADWIKLSYENQKAGSTAVTLGVTSPPHAPIAIAPSAQFASMGLSVERFSRGLVLNISGTSTAFGLSIVDMWGRTVWSRNVDAGGSHRIVWNGSAQNGIQASAGIYVVRMVPVGQKSRVLEKRVAYTP